MSDAFQSRITRAPRVYDRDRADEALATVSPPSGELRDLVAGAAGSSPYLAGLIKAEAKWLGGVWDMSPEASFAALLAQPVDNPARDLRVKKARVALLTALADLSGVWPVMTVTGALTDFADHAVDVALKAAIGDVLRRGKLPGQSAEDVATAAGLSVIAMGKMGAGELNYSSDIDLICLFDETRFDPDDYAQVRQGFVTAVRAMCKTLSERTADGYVFRTDLRLRPDASVTPVAISMEAAERYYESFGRTWERAAFIKARAAAGDIQAGTRFLQGLTPFVWRRHLDFAAIQDAQDMRQRIKAHKGLTTGPTYLGHDVKLGQGGIREIEFFTQTQQLISGGRDVDLRGAKTLGALQTLAGKDRIDVNTAEQLAADYQAHRTLEHQLQMIADQQTHVLPDSQDDFNRVAALAGRDATKYAAEIVARFERVSKLTEPFFLPSGQTDMAASPEPFPDHWQNYPALRSPRATEILGRVWPSFSARIAKAGNPTEALAHFDTFLKGLPAGVQLFSMFEANLHLLDLVIDIIDTAPELASYLARNSRVFDAVIGGDFFADWPGIQVLAQQLSGALAAEDDYEKKLDRARVWAREWHFRIGVHFLRGVTDADGAGAQYADLARAILTGLWPVVEDEFSRKHGAPPGRGASVLAMGSLGAGWLTAGSDLDLIVIFDAGGEDYSDGPRPLAVRPYFARLTQALVTALSAPTAEGRLYQVDMRLRPSGRQGPVATSIEAFKAYQTDQAWTWEHLALTRAAPIVGNAFLSAGVAEFRQTLMQRPRDRAQILDDVRTMRVRLGGAKPAQSWLDVRAGAGGLQDIELLAQTAVLLSGGSAQGLADQLADAVASFDIPAADRETLETAASLFRKLRAGSQLVFGDSPDTEAASGAMRFLLRETGAETADELRKRVEDARQVVDAIVTRLLGA
jgi:glutamate-ammonia-ligase adenylyltransferase